MLAGDLQGCSVLGKGVLEALVQKMRHLSSPAVTRSQRETAGKHTSGVLTGSVVGRQHEGKGASSMLADSAQKRKLVQLEITGREGPRSPSSGA